MNKMKEVAEMFGVELEEVFYVSDAIDSHVECIFTENCVERRSGTVWLPANNILVGLLTGVYELKKAPWKPKLGERYYYPMFSSDSMVECGMWRNAVDEKILRERGLVCQSRDAALQLAKIMLNSLEDNYDGEV